MLRIFRGAVRAYVAINDLEKAELAGMVLIDLVPMSRRQRRALAIRQAPGKETERGRGRRDRRGRSRRSHGSQEPLAAMNQLLGKLFDEAGLARDGHVAHGMVWIAETSSAVGLDRAAEMQCQQFLKLIQSNPAFRRSLAPMPPRASAPCWSTSSARRAIRGSHGTGYQTDRGTPHGPGTETGRMSPATLLGREGPRPGSRRPEGVRGPPNFLDRITGKKPSEYYEVVYIEADSFYMQGVMLDKEANKVGAAEAAKKGQQILRAALFSKPDLDGPDRVAQYRDLLSKFDRLQGRTPASKKPEK